jgi:hypothetical protein
VDKFLKKDLVGKLYRRIFVEQTSGRCLKQNVMAHTLSIAPYFIAAAVIIYKFNKLTKLK